MEVWTGKCLVSTGKKDASFKMPFTLPPPRGSLTDSGVQVSREVPINGVQDVSTGDEELEEVGQALPATVSVGFRSLEHRE